jgi:hypothetical protein
MTIQSNTQVMDLWREQNRMLEQSPEMVAAHVADIGVYLTTLHDRADGNEELMGMIQSCWSRVQGIQTMFFSQMTALTSACIIIPALKVQRDELALEMERLLQAMGLASEEGSPVNGLLAALYEGWRETLDTSDIESDSQDELLDVIYGDIEGMWGLDEGGGAIVMGALRGHTNLTDKQYQAFKTFLGSLGGDA